MRRQQETERSHAPGRKWMDLMQEHDDELNRKVILLSIGSAAAAALLVALARHRDDQGVVSRSGEVAARAEDVVSDAKQKSKKAAKSAKNKRKELAAAVAATGHRAADEIRDATERLDFDAKAAERDLKAAAWDAQQEAKEAESRLRAASHRVVDDATHIASWVGAEARNLAGEGKEKIAQLRHREEGEGSVEREVERLRAEIDELKDQLRKTGQKREKFPLGLTSRFTGKSGPSAEVVASEAAAAALAQIERTLRAKAPALLAARNKAQVLEILQKELGPTLRDTAVQAAVAALGKWDWTRESGDALREADDQARTAAADARETARRLGDDIADEVERVAEDAAHRAETIQANGKRRFWRAAHDAGDAPAGADTAEALLAAEEKDDRAQAAGEEHRGKAGLFWGGAGIGLALYALLDAERRDRVLRLANEASVQVQELVRDLQGYDDEF
jgi:gas vesicle protein